MRNYVNWKLQLAQDIAQSLGQSRNREDFIHFLNKRGITADFGAKNILFEWILKKKGSSAVISEYSPKPLAQRQRGLLETIDRLIEPQQKNNPPPRPQPVKQIINDRDEWEMQ